MFLQFVRIDTRAVEPAPDADPVSMKHPSSPGQTVLVDLLRSELEDTLGDTARLTTLGNGSLMVELAATNGCVGAPHVVFAVHVDTSPDQPGLAEPLIHQYVGGNIVLPKGGTIIPAEELKGLEGKTIITSSGDTLLGVDDKAGIAVLMSAIEWVVRGRVPHGPITLILCTDEEIGELGLDHLPPEKVATWDVFWTLDGGPAGEIDIGCFYGVKCSVTFTGNDAHPGECGTKIKSALYAACGFVDSLSRSVLQPWDSSGNDSFVYAARIRDGSASRCVVELLPRSFDRDELMGLLYQTITELAAEQATRLGVKAEVSEMDIRYVSTEEAIARHPEHVALAEAALQQHGLTVKKQRCRGGTDGAMMNVRYPDLSAPNLGIGERNCHQLTEFVVADEITAMVPVVVEMISAYGQMKK
ncbi:MAG: M20/M25/M40 family metallo-hydrolase [Patescibacteria group bacterium]|nr:M20/M25/M40 family metallo-hydrolase [Patescibacteria group bacterium]